MSATLIRRGGRAREEPITSPSPSRTSSPDSNDKVTDPSKHLDTEKPKSSSPTPLNAEGVENTPNLPQVPWEEYGSDSEFCDSDFDDEDEFDESSGDDTEQTASSTSTSTADTKAAHSPSTMTKKQPTRNRTWKKLTAWYNIGLLGTIVSILGFVAALLHEFRPSVTGAESGSWLRSIRWDLVGLLIIFISVPTTHWFVGRRRHRSAFSAFQPFVGGARFVILQAISWAVYGCFTLGIIWVAYKGALGLTNFVVSSLGLTGVLVQLLTITSIHYFSNKQTQPDATGVGAGEVIARRRRLSSGATRAGRARSVSSASSSTEVAQSPPSPAPERSAIAGHVGTALTFLSLIAAVLLESLELSPDPDSSSGHRATVASVVGISSVLVAVPLTHGMGGVSLYPSHYKLYQPFKGGPRFVLLQALGWALWTITLIIAIAVGSAGLRHAQSFRGLLTAGGCFAVVSQVLVLHSLKYFDARVSIARNERRLWARIERDDNVVVPTLPEDGLAVSETKSPAEDEGAQKTSPLPEIPETSLPQIAVEEEEKARTEEGVAADLRSEVEHTKISRLEVPTDETSLVPSLPAVPPLTPLASSALREEIRREVVLNAATAHAKTAPPLRFHEAVEGISLLMNRERIYAKLLDFFDLLVVATLFHFPLLASVFVLGPIGLAYYFGPLSPQFLSVVVCQALYYSTYLSDHHITGKLASPNARKPIWLWRAFRRYFHGRIISKASYLDPAKQYQFCFHPHGIYPMTCFWATRSEEFQALHPDIEVDILGASVIMFAPAMRELFLWSGGRDVSKRALLQCYSERRNVMLVPGGQKEMRWVNGGDRNKFMLYTKHQGFVRLALQNGVALVPVISFGENDILHNVSWPTVQAWTYRRIGVALPMYPHGRWYTPIPNRVKVTVVFGEPIYMPTIAQPTKEEVDMYHRQYYEAVRQLFESSKADAGYPEGVLEFV